jgi:HEPN domain-containing protein
MRWLDEAEKKLKATEFLIKEGYNDAACLMAYLGALLSLYQLIESTVTFSTKKEGDILNPSIVFLIKRASRESLPATTVTFATKHDIIHSARVLETYSLPLRIPASIPEGTPSEYIDREMAEEALRHAKAIMEFVKREVG